ncbi:hypothetical protein MMC06_004554, partial [Schaereria dolodes]|nr:hypothetical protein [Schaereria dolodes]
MAQWTRAQIRMAVSITGVVLLTLLLFQKSPYSPTRTWKWSKKVDKNPPTDPPLKLWQTGASWTEPDQSCLDTWLSTNPNLRHEFLTDASAETFVRERFASRPDILDPFLAITKPILRADILRQLVLLADGGVYSDLDVNCHVPIAEWIPAEYRPFANLVV